MPVVAIYICAAMLFIGGAPLPYGYYVLLRLIAFGVFAFSAYVAYERGAKVLPWIFGFMALVFNPIIKIPFQKDIWIIVDVAAGLLLLVTSKAVRTNT